MLQNEGYTREETDDKYRIKYAAWMARDGLQAQPQQNVAHELDINGEYPDSKTLDPLKERYKRWQKRAAGLRLFDEATQEILDVEEKPPTQKNLLETRGKVIQFSLLLYRSLQEIFPQEATQIPEDDKLDTYYENLSSQFGNIKQARWIIRECRSEQRKA